MGCERQRQEGNRLGSARRVVHSRIGSWRPDSGRTARRPDPAMFGSGPGSIPTLVLGLAGAFGGLALSAVGEAARADPPCGEMELESSARPSGRPLWRLEWQELAPFADDAELATWLLDDSIRWNATAAADELFERIDDPDRYRGAVAALWPLLDSQDLQAATVAAGLLQRACLVRHEGMPEIVPDDRLMAMSVQQALRYRGYVGRPFLAGELNSIDSVRFVQRHARQAAPWLVEAVRAHRDGNSLLGDMPAEGENWRLRDYSWPHFMGAYLLSFAPEAIPVEEAAEALIPHLHDNWDRYDALMAMAALGRFGPSAAGACRRALADSTDEQQRACLEMLLAHWDWPRDSALRQETLERLRARRLTWKVIDPILEWDFELQTW